VLNNNWLALGLTLAIALLWLQSCNYMAKKGWVTSKLSRKIIHIGTGPIFVLCWLLFNNDASARWLAAIVPLLITVQFILIGVGVIKDEASVKAMSRTGDRREILLGPLFYGIVFVILTLVYWKDSPIGIIALMILCGGDGFADIIGSMFGRVHKIPWSKEKSFIGSLAFFLGGAIFSIIVIFIFMVNNIFDGLWIEYIARILAICFVVMVIESLPIKHIDNVTVPLAAVIMGEILF
jgi:phytol kinase